MMVSETDKSFKNVAGKPTCLVLFGGSFDPIHCAHLEVAHRALEQTGADRVIFIPASRSPLKHRPIAKDADRLRMLQLALDDEVKFELNTLEIEQNKISYTINTVDYFRELYEDTKLFWIIGEDQFAHLDKWRRIDELVKKINFLVYPRLGNNRMFNTLINGLCYQLLKAKTLSVSSTEIRERCEKRLRLSGLVPESVEAYIYAQGLYGKEN